MGATVKVEGARQLRSTMRKAGADLGDLGAIHATVSRYVAARAAAYAPKRTGTLAASLRGSKGKTSAVVRAGGARVPYAGPIHWGWPKHKITAQPFAATAAEVTEPTWSAWYLKRVEQIVAKIHGA